MATQIDEVPDKLFYKVGEVCQYTDTQPYVLRFWESEFPQLAGEKNRSGQRVYRRDDIELIFRIKKLLYDEEYTIAGARRRLEQEIAGQLPTDEPGDRVPSAAHSDDAGTSPAPRAAPPRSHALPPDPHASLPVGHDVPPVTRTREARRLPLDELLPDDPLTERHVAAGISAAGPAAAAKAQAEETVDVLRREVHDLRAALARAEKSLGEAEDSRLTAERGRLAADEARRTAEDQRDALRAKLKRAAARVTEAIERLGPENTAR